MWDTRRHDAGASSRYIDVAAADQELTPTGQNEADLRFLMKMLDERFIVSSTAHSQLDILTKT
ncbi:hypothetical protein [Methylobacterium sp. WL12]|uniref:hypothetical protein n=1 Tax=Methylobacterium sp. WL12 TaxID=2603890 RepID=UPI0016502562|nr:hypothetical protein [Methylobacterium sp. WL12]